jgi:hypothetical protein
MDAVFDFGHRPPMRCFVSAAMRYLLLTPSSMTGVVSVGCAFRINDVLTSLILVILREFTVASLDPVAVIVAFCVLRK